MARSRNWAVVIGINQYNPNNFTPLRYAKRDAELMRDFFQQECQFDQVCYFSDDSADLTLPTGTVTPTLPSFGNLLSFLQDRFEQSFLQAGDNCWFFFAGHGQQYENRDYLMPIDANPRAIAQTAIPVSYVRERLSRCGADNVILILDACRSEGGRSGMGVGNEVQQGVITIAACSPTQKSWEIEALQQGAFTYALLEALRLPGERSCATVERLDRYLRDRVPALCRQYEKLPEQLPRISADPSEKHHFILLPQHAWDADIAVLKSDTYRAAFENRVELAKQLCVRAIAASMGRDLELLRMFAQLEARSSSPANAPISMPTPVEAIDPPSAPVAQPLTNARRKRLTQQLESFESAWQIRNEKVKQLRQAEAIETSAAYKFQLEQQIKVEETELRELEQRIDRIEQELGIGGVSAQPQSPGSASRGDRTPAISRTISLQQKLICPHCQHENQLNLTFCEVCGLALNPSSNAQPSDRSTVSLHQSFSIELTKTVQLEMIAIPGGKFWMGSPDGVGKDTERPRHEVSIAPFFMSKYPITQAQYQAVMGKNPSHFKGEKRPVECVTWHDAIEFCQKLSERGDRQFTLPSEAQWEYACRAGTETPFYFGETISTEQANYDGNYVYGSGKKGTYRKQTIDVGSFPPNQFGLYDMHGNVWEWCADHWHSNYEGAPIDGKAWLTENQNASRLLRGGSWYNGPDYCRSAFRGYNSPDPQVSHVGFRVVSLWPRTLLCS